MLVAKCHQKVRRQRRDFLHKTALVLVRNYDTIYLEDLRVANMVRNRHLSQSISDAGWYQFRTILAFKAVSHAPAGRHRIMKMCAPPPALHWCYPERRDGPDKGWAQAGALSPQVQFSLRVLRHHRLLLPQGSTYTRIWTADTRCARRCSP